MLLENRSTFLSLVRLGIGHQTNLVSTYSWEAIKDLGDVQGLPAIVLDGIEKLPDGQKPPQVMLLEWIGEVLQSESQYEAQKNAAKDMANLFAHNEIRTYVLKGETVSECYPKPYHRVSSDLDCFLVPRKGSFNAWELGNDLIKSKGYGFENVFYKNSTFFLPGLMVENHRFLTPFRGNKRLASLEKELEALIYKDEKDDRFDGTWLYRPPVMVTALFLVEHAYSHFLHEGLMWRHVLDWMMFREKHEKEINWPEFETYVNNYGFKVFYESFYNLGQYLLGELPEGKLSKKDRMMLSDIWAPMDLHESVRGFKGKLRLVGNTWRARWKYKHFTEISWVTALWIQVKGFLFEKSPVL